MAKTYTVSDPQDWQSATDFAETNLTMLTHKIACDVSFRVGLKREIIMAHKYILVSRSSVFFSMFYGPLAEKAEVEIPEIDSDVFHSFLRYLYTNSVELTTDSVTGLLYAAKKYSVKSLSEKCVSFLDSALNADNACDILEQAHLYNEEDLAGTALRVITVNALDVFKSLSFKEMSRQCLNRILESDDLRADEMSVFCAVLWWSEAECVRQGREITPDSKCDVLGDSINYVRFPLIGLKSFELCIGILDKDWLSLLRPFFDTRIDIDECTASSMSARPRKQLPTRVNRFLKTEESLSWTFNEKRSDAISFSCDTPVELLGVMLYGAFPTPDANRIISYSVECSIEEDLRQDYLSHTFFKGGNVLEGSYVEKTVLVSAQEHFMDVLFETPLHLTKDLKYTIVLNVCGPDSRRGCRGRSTCVKDEVCWTFNSSSKSKNSTDVEHGQIPGLIYSCL
ncbi:BTB/POZ domain-containing protein 6-like [Haliotis rufescens]|uniref:BTB/POZ domain-containing protein 6-like n=1 Tax=Haliotis rufescens TaxID=6454 RepID=UPI00201E84FC|nr:BTB/POZ domain-containing protein 6-like [Haliotis rufescens]